MGKVFIKHHKGIYMRDITKMIKNMAKDILNIQMVATTLENGMKETRKEMESMKLIKETFMRENGSKIKNTESEDIYGVLEMFFMENSDKIKLSKDL